MPWFVQPCCLLDKDEKLAYGNLREILGHEMSFTKKGVTKVISLIHDSSHVCELAHNDSTSLKKPLKVPITIDSGSSLLETIKSKNNNETTEIDPDTEKHIKRVKQFIISQNNIIKYQRTPKGNS